MTTTTTPTTAPRHKAYPALSVKVLDAEQGILEAIVSTFSVLDCYNDRIHPGFFEKSLKRKFPKGVWMHDWSIPIAKTLDAEEWVAGDERLPEEIREFGGLYIKGQFNLKTQRGREAFSDIEFGIIDEFSIGFYPLDERYDAKTGINELYEGDLVEWSPVLRGANPITTVISTKSALHTVAQNLHEKGEVATEFNDLQVKTAQILTNSGIKFKGQYLGENVEKRAAYYAISDIYYSLHWYLCDQIFSDGESSERRLNMVGAFDEFRDVCLKIIDALALEVSNASPQELEALQAEYKSLFLQKPTLRTVVEETESKPAFNAAKAKASRRLQLTELRARV